MNRRAALPAALLATATTARAAPHWFTGFEAVDATAGTSRALLEDLTETGTATLSYPVVQNQSSIGVVHSENNGGAATSKWAKYYSATTTGTIYDAVAVTPKDYNMCATINLHVDAVGTETDTLGFIEDIGAATFGCGVRVTTGRRFNLWYRSLGQRTTWGAVKTWGDVNIPLILFKLGVQKLRICCPLQGRLKRFL